MYEYYVDLRYIEGKNNVIADALSRVSCMEPPVDANEVPLIEILSTLPASPTKLDEIREQTREDVTLDHLKEVIHHRWPEYPSQCPPDLNKFWNFCEDLSVENGLVLK